MLTAPKERRAGGSYCVCMGICRGAGTPIHRNPLLDTGSQDVSVEVRTAGFTGLALLLEVAPWSEAGEQLVEWGGCAVGVEGFDEEAAVADLAAFFRAEEAPQLLLWGAVLLGGLP